MTRPRLLDLFCGAGGCSVGYARAGFDVFGVDVSRNALRAYPFPYRRGDALAYVAAHGHDFDVIHASPPCQAHTTLKARYPDRFDRMLFPMTSYPDLIPETRTALIATGRPYVIENVPFAPLIDPLILCGSMFGLGAECDDGYRQLRRHRLFESNLPLVPPGPCTHAGSVVGVYGNGGGGLPAATRGYKANRTEGRAALGIDWMGVATLSEAIPPAYTEWIGRQLIAQLCTPARRER